MQRLNKNLASSAITKITNSLKSGEIRQLEILLDLMSEDGVTAIGKLRAELFPQSTDDNKASANVAINRLINRINDVFAAEGSKVRLAITADKKAGDKRECWFEAEPVQFPIPHTPQLDAIPDDQLEQGQLGQPVLDVDIVLVTFNQHELEQTLKCFCPNASAVQMERHNRIYYQLGKHGGQNVVLVHSQQATLGAIKSVEVAIDFFQPKAIIAVGIAFGINSEKQQIGEVLISKSIIPYELGKIDKEGNFIARGPRPAATGKLIQHFEQLDSYLQRQQSAEYAKRHFGSVLSGDKLVDNKHYRDKLQNLDSETIGGEMEGTGLFYACEPTKTDWIIVKAICDFADGNKSKNKEANQKIAAENAARLVKAALDFGSIYPVKKSFATDKVRTKPFSNNFHDYKAICKDLNNIDELALVKDARALPTTLKKEQAALLEQEQTNGIPVVVRLLDWAKELQGKSVFTLLGEYGMGKTISCQMFDKQLRVQLQQNKKLPVPLYFDLRHVTSKTLADGFHFPDIIQDCIRFGWFKNETQEDFTTGDIERWANQSGVVLIFDGLDEVLVKIEEPDGHIFTDQLYKYQVELAAKTRQPVKMLLTCRSQYFKTLDRQKDHFTGQERGGVKPDDIEAMVMLPLTEEQITNYLRHALPGIEPATIIDMVKSVHDLHDLSKRPFTLKLVGEFFPALEEDRKSGKAISGVSLYRRVVDRWLNRDNGKHQIKSDHKLQLASHLAALLWKQKQSALPASEIEDWFMGWLADNPKIAFRYQGISPDILEEDLRTATFLCREDDEQGSRFRFSHTSLQEFFLASYLLQAINDNKPEAWAIAKPSYETLVFLAQLLAEPEHKQLLTKLSEWRKEYRQYTSENLLHYSLVAYGLGFSLPVLQGIQLNGAMLTGFVVQASVKKNFSLENANFSNAILRRAQFSCANLTGANFGEAQLDNAEFDQCNLNSSRWAQAEMTATHFFRCSLAQTNLETAVAYRSRLLHCESLPNVTLQYPQWLINTPVSSNNNVHYSTVGHADEVTSCVLSIDGRYLYSGSSDNSIRQWDMSTGECIREFIGHTDSVLSCVLSADGRYLMSGSHDNSIRQWDINSGECVRKFIGHTKGVSSCAVSTDGRYLFSASEDNSVRQWNLNTGECIGEFIGHTYWVLSCALSANDRYLVSGSADNSVRLWDLDTGKCMREFIGHTDSVSSCALSADGRYLFSASEDKSVRQWDSTTGECVHKFLGHTKGVACCALSADGRYLFSSSEDNVRQWELSTGECVQEFIGHTDWVSSCALSFDGQFLVSGSHDGSLRQWDLSTGKNMRKFDGSLYWVLSCALSVDGRYLVSSSQDNNVRQWDLSTGKCVREFEHADWVSSCALSIDGRYLVTGSYDHIVRQWDINNGECMREFIGHTDWVSSCTISRDGHYLFSASDDNSVRQWDMSTGECVREFIGHIDSVTSCAISRDGSYLVSGSCDKSIRQWDLSTGEYICEFIGHTAGVSSCTLSEDGRYLVSASEDNRLRLWDISTGKCVREFIGHTHWVLNCALSEDGRYLVSASEDNRLRLWDISTGKCVREFIGHKAAVSSCVLSVDGRYLVSCSYDSSICIWSLETAQPLKIIYNASYSNYLSVDVHDQKILAHSEYAWRYFNGYFINEEGKPDSFPVI